MKAITLVLSILILISCTNPKKKKPDSDKQTMLSNEQLLDTIQYQTFQYFWKGAEPTSGLARERMHMDNHYPRNDQNVITLGGSGFGVMAILVGVERGFITRQQALKRYQKIVDYLAKADRFHGAWPHWLNGETGKVRPFSKKDDGGDLVETSFMIHGLLTVAEYFRNGNEAEKQLVNDITKLWEEVEWDWYTQGGQDVLYWHWSPNLVGKRILPWVVTTNASLCMFWQPLHQRIPFLRRHTTKVGRLMAKLQTIQFTMD